MPHADSTTQEPDSTQYVPLDPNEPVREYQAAEYDSGGIIIHRHGCILTPEEFEEFVGKARLFYQNVKPGHIEANNHRQMMVSYRLALDCLAGPDETPAPPRRTCAGYVYLLRSDQGHYKIGRTKDVQNRHAMIATKMPFKVDLIHTIACEDYINAERMLHEVFADKRLNGEWFDLTPDNVLWLTSIKEMTAEEVAE